MIEIRPELKDDRHRVHWINERAFGRTVEARLVAALRGAAGVLSLVAVADGDVVGHILFTPVTVGKGGRAMALGPMAVLPASQRQGVGSALVRKGLEACREAGAKLVFVLGHVEYYPRFGFRSAWESGFYFGEPSDLPAFMMLELEPGAASGMSGEVRYRPEFEGLD